MEDDTQRALNIFYELRKDLIKSEQTVKLKHLNQLISLLESSFFNKIVVLHKSLDALKKQKNLKPDDLQFDIGTGGITAEIKDHIMVNETKQLPLSPEDFQSRLQSLVGSRELIHIEVEKTTPSQTLGFSIKCAGSLQSNGVFVEEVTKGGLAERCGIKAQYQIVAINGLPLDNPDMNKDMAVKALKSSNHKIDLYFARDTFVSQISPSREVAGHVRTRSDIMFSKELNTEWTEYEILDLKSIDGTFGFGIMGGLTSEVMVRTVLYGGAADMDGHLRINDHIMYINEHPVRHLSSIRVAEILKSAGDSVRLIVARPFDPSGAEVRRDGRVQMVETTSLDARLQMIVAQIYRAEAASDIGSENEQVPRQSEEEQEDSWDEITVTLFASNMDRGLTVICVNSDLLSGTFVSSVVLGGDASNSGIRKYDRISKINDVPTESDNSERSVYRMLSSADQPTTILLRRYKRGPTLDNLLASDLFSQTDKKHSLEKMQRMKAHSTSSDSSDGSSVSEGYSRPSSTEEQEDPHTRWIRILGEKFVIVVAEFSKFKEDGSLGISLEGTVDVDEYGLEVHPHHYIRSITPGGPAALSGILREKDELLEVNGVRIYGVNHIEAVKVLKNVPMEVSLVCARIMERGTEPVDYSSDVDSIESDKVCQDLDDVIAFETGSRSIYSIKSKSQDNMDQWPKEDNKSNDQTCRSRSLDQVNGLAIWDQEITYVDLEKRSNGLGFSILDYQDPVNPQESVIVIRSLVPNGAAAKDERIFPGDRLMSVNTTDVSRASMAEAVEALKRTEPGLVRLGIVKALCLDTSNSQEDSQSPDSNISKQYDNVSSPRVFEDFDDEETQDDLDLESIPEALEHKIKIHKLSGQPLGLRLKGDSEGSGNENGYPVAAIDPGSPAARSGQISVGDLVTKIDDLSLRNMQEEEVSIALRKVTSCAGYIRISFIPEADFQIFLQSRTMQDKFRREARGNRGPSGEVEGAGFFPKPSAIKASGGKLLFINPVSDVSEKEKRKEARNDYKPLEQSPIINRDRRSRISSLVDLYDNIWGEDKGSIVCRQESPTYDFEVVG